MNEKVPGSMFLLLVYVSTVLSMFSFGKNNRVKLRRKFVFTPPVFIKNKMDFSFSFL